MKSAGTQMVVLRCKALANPVRLRILFLLKARERCVCQIKAATGLPNSTISEQLSYLREAGLIVERREGRWAHFRVASDPEARRFLKLVWPFLESDPSLGRDLEFLDQLPRRGKEPAPARPKSPQARIKQEAAGAKRPVRRQQAQAW
jgi:ArsR family transcriptional regulator